MCKGNFENLEFGISLFAKRVLRIWNLKFHFSEVTQIIREETKSCKIKYRNMDKVFLKPPSVLVKERGCSRRKKVSLDFERCEFSLGGDYKNIFPSVDATTFIIHQEIRLLQERANLRKCL